ncbi:hypothetical protein B5M42_002160 [Paenibacillus athensensis]|uniref:Uncharacterized protein n=1 Tax=Paenibacillus athensensis TaxID=1967502 RepID=A0A4Y8QAB4_9BACL|nr:hypothetical protein [Paenibacillus athensensis]MCD1257642.1 hypothetical protein [Paenibacillus athensensis]
MEFILKLHEVYIQIINLDPATKFIITFLIGLGAFLYKTFLNLYSENDKQTQPIKIKEGELLAKLEAAIAIYEKGTKDLIAQDKLVEKLGECYCYLSTEHKQKVRLFYENRSDSTLATLRKLTCDRVDQISTFGEKPLLIDQISSYIKKICRPLAPLISISILLILIAVNYSTYLQENSFWGKLNVTASWTSGMLSLVLSLSMINILIENRWIRGLGFKPWAYITIIILCPLIAYLIQPQLTAFAAIVQIGFMITLSKSRNSA